MGANEPGSEPTGRGTGWARPAKASRRDGATWLLQGGAPLWAEDEHRPGPTGWKPKVPPSPSYHVGQGLGDTGTESSQGQEGQPTEPEAMAEWLVRAGGQNCSTMYSGIPNTALISIRRRAQTCLPANLQPGVATWLSLLSGVTTAVCHLLVMPSEGTGMCTPVPSHQRGCRRDMERRRPQGPRRVLC